MWGGFWTRSGRRVLFLAAAAAAATTDPVGQVLGDPRGRELVAVLELEGRSRRLSLEDAQYVTDAVRKVASDALDPARFLVMTRENMDIIVPPRSGGA